MFVAVNRINLFYEMVGYHDKTIILLHGNGEDHTIFKKLVPLLARDYRVILVDLRAHGQSDYVSYLTYEDMVQDIYELIQTLKIKRPMILGFSDGAIIGLTLAYKYPYLIDKLIACGPNLSKAGFKTRELIRLHKDYLLSKDDKIRLMLEQKEITIGELNKITCNTLILAGENDCIKESHLKIINKYVNKSELKIYKKHNHFSYLVNSDYAYKDIDLFLRKK